MRLALELETDGVESLRHEGRVAHEEEPARGVLGGRGRAQDRLRIAAVERSHEDLVALDGRGAPDPGQEKEVRPVREEEREPVRVVAALGVQFRELLHLPAVRGHGRERTARRRREHDDALRAPGPALWKVRRRAQDRRRSARGVDLLELLVRAEGDEPAVGRPERVLGAVGSRERLGVGGVQGTDVETHLRVRPARRECELPPVGRKHGRARLRRVDGKHRALRRRDRRAIDAPFRGASAQRERPRGGRERGRDGPGNVEGRAAALRRRHGITRSRRAHARGPGDRPLEGDARLADRLQALLRVALEAALEQHPHGRRCRGRQLPEIHRLAKDGGERVAHGLALEEALAGQHLEEDDAERPDVGSLVDRLAARLLGRHVSRRPEDHPGRRRSRRQGRRV